MEITITCDTCSADAEYGLCEKHHGEELHNAYDTGYTEGFEAGQNAVGRLTE